MSDLPLAIDLARPTRPLAYPPNTDFGGLAILFGYAIKESTGLASAELDIYDGSFATSTVYIPLPLTPGQAVIDWFGPNGIQMQQGIYTNVASGSIVGSIFVAYDIQSGKVLMKQ